MFPPFFHSALVTLADIPNREISNRFFSQVPAFKPSGCSIFEGTKHFFMGANSMYEFLTGKTLPIFLGIGMCQAVTLDVKFTSLSPI